MHMNIDEQRKSSNRMMSTSSGVHWYLVHCKPHEDGRALEHLERQGFECFRPMRQVERRREGRKIIRAEPLFPRYLFIHLDCVHDNWSPIQSTRGVIKIVRFNADPLPVPDAVVAGIRDRLARTNLTEPYLKPGERVRIVDGAFSQLEAIFLANDGDERVVLLLSMLQQEQKLVFPAHVVRKVSGR